MERPGHNKTQAVASGRDDSLTREEGMKLYYVEKRDLDVIAPHAILHSFQGHALLDALRLNTLYMIQQAGSGHPGGSLSSLGIMVDLFWNKMAPEDIFISSKGHDAPALYAVMQARGIIPFDTIHTLRRPGGLPGHPTIDVPGIIFNTGSLGMGISKANGLAWADRARGIERKIYVLVGDGELQEGQNWEALSQLPEAVEVHVDWNGWQLHNRTPTSQYLDGPLQAPRIPVVTDRLTIHKTTKGSGISFMEGDNKYHAGALTDNEYAIAADEIRTRLTEAGVKISTRDREPYHRPAKSHEATKAYSQALWHEGAGELGHHIIVMDADLAPDCGLTKFAEDYPDQFVQCGIAEQNMVSMATGIAEGGYIPIVHSFAAFLCRRANEQIYNACLERRHIVFVGTMAGILPTGPGTSHECLEDIALMKTMPNMTVLQPSDERAVQQCLAWAVREATGPVYISLTCWPIEGSRR